MVAVTPSVKNFAALPAPRASCLTCDCICVLSVNNNRPPSCDSSQTAHLDAGAHKRSDTKPLSCFLAELTSGSASPFVENLCAPKAVACATGAHEGPALLCEASLAKRAALPVKAFMLPANRLPCEVKALFFPAR